MYNVHRMWVPYSFALSGLFILFSVGTVTKSMCQVSKNVHRALVLCVREALLIRLRNVEKMKKEHSNGIKIKVSNVRPMNDERKSMPHIS